MWRLASVSSVVQLWPAGGTYCRSSSQIGHAAGGLSLGAYCVPQVLQMKAGMTVRVCAQHQSRRSHGRCWPRSGALRPPPMNSAAMAAPRHSVPDSMKALM